MKFRLPFQTLRGQLILWFLLLAALPLLVFGALLYRQQAQAIRDEASDKLAAVRSLKVERITAWMAEFSGDLESIAAHNRVTLLPDGKLTLQTEAAALQRVRDYFNNYRRFHSSFTDLSVIDPATARILVSTTGKYEGESVATSSNLLEPLRTKTNYFRDVHFSDLTQTRRMNIAVPLLLPGPEATVAAIFVADIDMAVFDSLLLDRTGLGETGETLIVNKDLIALNKLRWHENAPLSLKLAAAPSIRAARGETGIVADKDYRGVPVLAAYTFIPSVRWGFVAKQDQAEIYEPITALTRTLLVLLVICIALAALLALPVVATIARPLLAIQKTAEAFGAGNLASRNRSERSDELGSLALAFDRMADQVQSARASLDGMVAKAQTLLTIQQGHGQIMEAMTHSGIPAAFCGELLQVMMRATHSDLGAFYLLGADGQFAPVAAQGLSAAALEPFDSHRLEGALGTAFATRQVCHLHELPADTLFTFRTVAGTAVPRALLTIPVVVGDHIVALIALAALRDYPPEALAIVNSSMTAFGVGLANLLASAESRRLAADLALKNTELEAQTGELAAQATELRKQADILQTQNTQLEVQSVRVAEANRLKSAFLSNMSHELRTPLNSVLALSRVLQMQGRGRLSDEETSYLAIIERNGKHLLSLINDILDLAKIESGRMDLAAEELALGEQIAAVAESLEPLCREKGLALVVNVEPDLPPLWSDARRIHQVLQNVMGNAVKFTPAGRVTVTARRRGGEVEVTVTDTGIGIPERDLPHIFDEFRQVDSGTARLYEGSGLGLAIVAKSVHLLGGRIEVQSQLGSGSTFTITLPFVAPEISNLQSQISAAPAAAALQPSAISLQPATFSLQPSPSLPRRTVLVVDDNPDDASLIADYLASEGYDTIIAHSGKEALRLAETHRPFAVTLDVIMPDMDGWEVLQQLKQNTATANIPVIIVSMAEDRATGLALGAIGVVAKPVDRVALLAEVRRVTPPNRASVLVVDDADLDRQMVAGMIAAEGLEVTQARDGQTCLALVAERLPDALVLDLMMPGMSGFEVLDKLRTDFRTRHLPVIIVTARELSEEDRSRLRGRVATVVEKSRLAAGDLLKEISRILERFSKVAPHTATATAAPGRRLLLVEDSELAILQVRMILEAAGYRVDVARGGQEAFELMGDPPPDGILLDLLMPQMDGFAVLERLRSNPATAQTPVLILTAKDLTTEDLNRLSANNAQQLIQKGDLDRRELLRQVERLLRQRAKAPAPSEISNLKSQLPAVRSRPPAGQLPAILAIEDNPDNQATLRAILKDRCVLREATDGEAGLQAAFAQRPDLILLDLSLPKLDGWAVVQQLRAAPATKDIPVIVLTAHAMPGDRERVLAADCDDYLAKPIDVDHLLAALERWLGRGKE